MTTVSGARAVVTGGASGIGRGIAEALIAGGARVVIADVDEAPLVQTAREIGAVPAITDVSSLESVAALAETTRSELGGIDIVVNNAGIGPFARIADLTMADWRWIIDVNLYGVIHGVNVFLPLLEQNPDGGHIVNTSSMAAFTPLPTLGSYAVTKFGVAALTEVLQAELAAAHSRVHATLLAPGSVRSNIARSTRTRSGEGGALHDAEIDLSFADSARWLDPREVGEITLRAIRNDDDYAITHPERWPAVAARFERIRAAFTRYSGA